MLRLVRHLLATLPFLLAATAASAGDWPREDLVLRKLDNGLTLVGLPRPGSPVFCGVVMARVGSVDEPAGMTGVAHMMEHMAFKGTRHIGVVDYAAEEPLLEESLSVGDELARLESSIGSEVRGADEIEALRKRVEALRERSEAIRAKHLAACDPGEFFRLYGQHGAVGLNAATSPDFVHYVVNLPSNKMELWALMESQRLSEPVFRDFHAERAVVAEERRLRVDSNPFGKCYEAACAALFDVHPYRNPSIGWPSDIAALTAEEGAAFHARHFGPGNLVVVAVGGFEPDEFLALGERYFGRLRPVAEGPRPVHAIEAPPTGERRIEVSLPGGPLALLAFRKKGIPTREDLVCDLVVQLLAGGESSRLSRRLVDEERAAIAVSGFVGPGLRYDNAIFFLAIPRAPWSVDDCVALMRDELERLGREAPDAAEARRAALNVKARVAREARGNQGMAVMLAQYAHLTGDPLAPETFLADLETVTPEEIRDVARRVFARENGVLVAQNPPGQAGGGR